MMKQRAGNFKSFSFENTFNEILNFGTFYYIIATSAAVQNSNAGGKQLVRHTLKLKSVTIHCLNMYAPCGSLSSSSIALEGLGLGE